MGEGKNYDYGGIIMQKQTGVCVCGAVTGAIRKLVLFAVVIATVAGCNRRNEMTALGTTDEKVTQEAGREITGQCHCGAVRYAAKGPILRQGTCRCRPCQRATGALESPNIGVAPENLKIIAGRPSQYRSDSNEACDSGVWHLCSQCGSQLYWMNTSGTEVAIFAGTLDDTNLFVPEDE